MNFPVSPQRRKVLVAGSVKSDDVLCIQQWREEGKLPVLQRHQFVGGGGANVARCMRRLAPMHEVVLLGQIGSDSRGRKVRADLDEESIQVPIPMIAGETGSTVLVVPDTGESVALPYAGSGRATVSQELLDGNMREAALCLIAAPPLEFYEQVQRLIDSARVHDVPVSIGCGSAQRTDPKAFFRLLSARPVTVLILNQVEAKMLTGLADLLQQLVRLRELAQLVVVTKGAAGITAFNGKPCNIPAYRDPATPFIDSTGCGDAAHATLLWGLMSRYSLPLAVAAAARQGFAAGTKLGTTDGLIHQAEMIRYLDSLIHRRKAS